MVKMRRYELENAKAQWHDDENATLHRHFTNAPLRFHNHTIAMSVLHYRIFTIVPLRIHHRTAALSPS